MNDHPQGETEASAAAAARDNAQLLLGRVHGLLWVAVEESDLWLPAEQDMAGTELTRADLLRAAEEVHPLFGKVHAAINTGMYDADLLNVGFGEAQGEVKKKGFWSAIGRFFGGSLKTAQRTGREINAYLGRMRNGLQWSNTVVGSLSIALKSELERVPGAAAAAESIREFIEVLLNASEPVSAPDVVIPGDDPSHGDSEDLRANMRQRPPRESRSELPRKPRES